MLTNLGASAPDVASAGAPHDRVISPNTWAQERAVVSRAPTVCWSSRVGRGKSFGGCLNALLAASQVPGTPVALTRFERASMTNTTLEALRKLIGIEAWQGGKHLGLDWGWKASESKFHFPAVRCDDGRTRQSWIWCFGWKEPGRALSAEFARVIMDQAEEIDRDTFTIAQTRLRFVDPWCEKRYQELGLVARQMVLICNADDPEHWLNQDFGIEDHGAREQLSGDGKLLFEVVLSQPNDNAENLTADYHDRLESTRGTAMYDRLVGGRWVRATGTVYAGFYDPAVHVIDRPVAWAKWGGYPPPDWPRIRCFDFGVKDPFTVGWLAEHDRVLYEYRELYGTGRTGSEWAAEVKRLEELELRTMRARASEDEAHQLQRYLAKLNVQESWSDHDPEWRGELARAGVWTQKANKDIGTGILSVMAELKAGRLFFIRDALEEPDAELAKEKLPTSVRNEWGRYRWRGRPNSRVEVGHDMDLPVDRDNHGLDRIRYAVHSRVAVRRIVVAA